MRSKPRVRSAITRVKTSSRPVELFGLAARRHVVRQREAFEQRHDVDAVGFQHRAVGQRELVQLEARRCARRPWSAARAGSSRARDRRPCRAAGRGSPAGSDRARTRARDESHRSSPARRSCDRAGCPLSRSLGFRWWAARSPLGATSLHCRISCGEPVPTSPGNAPRPSIYPTGALTGSRSDRMTTSISWSFEPAGLLAT